MDSSLPTVYIVLIFNDNLTSVNKCLQRVARDRLVLVDPSVRTVRLNNTLVICHRQSIVIHLDGVAMIPCLLFVRIGDLCNLVYRDYLELYNLLSTIAVNASDCNRPDARICVLAILNLQILVRIKLMGCLLSRRAPSAEIERGDEARLYLLASPYVVRDSGRRVLQGTLRDVAYRNLDCCLRTYRPVIKGRRHRHGPQTILVDYAILAFTFIYRKDPLIVVRDAKLHNACGRRRPCDVPYSVRHVGRQTEFSIHLHVIVTLCPFCIARVCTQTDRLRQDLAFVRTVIEHSWDWVRNTIELIPQLIGGKIVSSPILTHVAKRLLCALLLCLAGDVARSSAGVVVRALIVVDIVRTVSIERRG